MNEMPWPRIDDQIHELDEDTAFSIADSTDDSNSKHQLVKSLRGAQTSARVRCGNPQPDQASDRKVEKAVSSLLSATNSS